MDGLRVRVRCSDRERGAISQIQWDSFASRTSIFFWGAFECLPYARTIRRWVQVLSVLLKCLPIHQDGTRTMTTTWWWCNFRRAHRYKTAWEKNQKAITCKNYYNSNNKHNSRLIDPRFKVQIGYLTVNRQTNKQIWAGHHPSAHS